MVELAFPPQACRDNGAGERAVAGGQIEHRATFERAAENVVERLLLLQNGGEEFGRGAPRRKSDLGVSRAGSRPRFALRGCHGINCL